MDEFEQSNYEKETNNSPNTCCQNAMRYKEKENAFINNWIMCIIFSCLCYKTRGPLSYLLDTTIRCFRAIRVGITIAEKMAVEKLQFH